MKADKSKNMIFLTDNPSNLTAPPGLLLSDDESGVRKNWPGSVARQHNMSNAMQEGTVYNLSKSSWRRKEIPASPLGGDENAELHASGFIMRYFGRHSAG